MSKTPRVADLEFNMRREPVLAVLKRYNIDEYLEFDMLLQVLYSYVGYPIVIKHESELKKILEKNPCLKFKIPVRSILNIDEFYIKSWVNKNWIYFINNVMEVYPSITQIITEIAEEQKKQENQKDEICIIIN